MYFVRDGYLNTTERDRSNIDFTELMLRAKDDDLSFRCIQYKFVTIHPILELRKTGWPQKYNSEIP